MSKRFLMEPGQSCRVYTDEVHPESCGFSFANDMAIWGNSGDVVELVDPSETVVDSACWGKACEWYGAGSPSEAEAIGACVWRRRSTVTAS